jgi:hypothetical protein
MRRTKKEVERAYLDKFLNLMNYHPQTIIEGESPDFLIKLDKDIGLEMVAYHSAAKGKADRPRRLIEEEWRLFQDIIMTEVEKYGALTETYGHLAFRELEIPSRKEYDKFLKELIDASLKMVSAGTQHYHPEENHPQLIKYLSSFSLEKVGCYITWDWNHNAALVGLTEDELIKTIRPKIEKAMKYSGESIDENWLLVVDGPYLSQEMGRFLQHKLPDFTQVDKLLRESKFNAVYIFQYMFDVVHQWPGWKKYGKYRAINTITS